MSRFDLSARLLRRGAGVVALAGMLAAPLAGAADWPNFGGNLQNTASPGANVKLDASRLQLAWSFTTAGEISARAAVVNGVVYFPDWGGYLYAVNARSGELVWKRSLAALLGSTTPVNSRTTPAVARGTVFIGTQEGGYLMSIDAKTGNLNWATALETSDPFAIVTASPVVHGNTVYTGVASNQEAMAAFLPGFVCCTARGSVVALDANTGAVAWKTYMTKPGFSGASVWGSSFAIDPSRGALFVSTGNGFSIPTDPAYQACISGGGSAAGCEPADNYVDAVLSLDLKSGAIKWATKAVTWNQEAFGVVSGSDFWNVACFVEPFTNCPPAAGPDYDFASAPNLITYRSEAGPKTILGVGQKSGIYFAFDPDSGAILWQTQVGPGSTLGGMEWGSASDGQRIYVSIANFFGIPTPYGSGGSWAALDPANGKIVWQVGDPTGSIALGPVTVADGAVYVSSMAGDPAAPTMLALDAATGRTVWNFAAGSSVNAGATVADGMLFWGSGYAHLGIPGFTTNNKFYAFAAR
jgi:polyvinyl alcohol dehydrogenase (cytochrome)